MTSYDIYGRRNEELIFDSSGSVARRTTREYLSDGNEQETIYSADGSVDKRLTFKFKRDSEGRITESSIFGSDGNLSSRSESSYDSGGRFIGGSTYNPDGSLSTPVSCPTRTKANFGSLSFTVLRAALCRDKLAPAILTKRLSSITWMAALCDATAIRIRFKRRLTPTVIGPDRE
jgi:hypothetical protein